MSNKLDRALYGPSWTEVILGAVLSVALGIVLAAAYLVFKPVTLVKELPKEPAVGMVYYIEGSHDSAKARRLATKQSTFLQGKSVVLTEDELNLAAVPPAPAGGKAPAPAAEPTDILTPGTMNVRLNSGALQLGVPLRVKYSLVGLDATVLVQTRGTFVKDGDVFVYRPDTVYLGSCPVQRLPIVTGFVMSKLLNASRFPGDVVTAWSKLSEVAIDGATLKLTMP